MTSFDLGDVTYTIEPGDSVEGTAQTGVRLSTEFLPRRINFGSRDNLGAWSASSAPFGCVLLIWDGSR